MANFLDWGSIKATLRSNHSSKISMDTRVTHVPVSKLLLSSTSHGVHPFYEMDDGPLSDNVIFAIRNTPDKQDFPTINFSNTLFKSGQTGERNGSA